MVALVGATTATAQDPDILDVLGILGDPHLTVIPRSADETARVATVTQPATTFLEAEPFEANPGGAATTPVLNDDSAFAQPSANLTFDQELDFFLGNAMFKKLWVSSPASTKASDGLGPLYNARSCQLCHINDGRGHPPAEPGDVSMVMRVSVAADNPLGLVIPGYHDTQPHPVYGGQLQDLSLPGKAPEARVSVTYEEIPVDLNGGETATLRKPTYHIETPGYGELEGAMLSPRVAPQMIGLGLLEAIPVQDILAHADETDADGDGISGKAQIVWSLEHGEPMLGRFGHKATMPTIRQQSADAAVHDIGISSPLMPNPWGDCTDQQPGCRNAVHGDRDERVYEMDDKGLELLTFYGRNLAVPARRDLDDPQVLRGKKLFHEIGCTSCHVPKFVTHRLDGQDAQSFQLIWPYSDLLLHDMGEGLADDRPDARADGREWRTAPLWGIGLTKQVSGQETYLHDGRARSLLEAVLWHGGEAQPHRDAVVTLSPEDRADLLKFLGSL